MPQPGATARLVRNEAWAKLHTDDPGVVDAVYRLLRFRPEGYAFMPRYQKGTWDGWMSLLKRRAGTFPGGLTERATDRLQELGVAVTVEDRCRPPAVEPQLVGGVSNITLRPYQVDACDKAMVAERGVIDAATGTGKCIAAGQQVWTARGLVLVENLQAGDTVWSLRPDWRLVSNSVQAVQSNGRKPVVVLGFRSGRTLRLTANHPVRRLTSWTDAGAVVVGDHLASARTWPFAGSIPVDSAVATVIGYMIGDGNCRTYGFTNTDAEVRADFLDACHRADFETGRTDGPTIYLTGGVAYHPAPAHALFKELGLAGCNSYTKRIPPICFAWPDKALAALIAAYWLCDGSPPPKNGGAIFYSVSPDLLCDTQIALRRFGIQSVMRLKRGLY